MVLTFILGTALAQSPEPSSEPEATATETSEADEELVIVVGGSDEMVVYGERLVDQARREVVETIEELGYDYEVKKQGDRVVYRHPSAWYGEVVLYDDGYMQVKRQRIRVEGRAVPWAKRRNSPGAWLGCFVYPWACIRVYGATVSRRRWMGTQTRTVAELAPKVEVLADRIADLETTRRVAALPGKLEALWDEGAPLDRRSGALRDPESRRQAILQYWGSRTETVWGRMVRETVENFVEAVVQTSEHPFTAAEIDAFNADRDVPFPIVAEPDDP